MEGICKTSVLLVMDSLGVCKGGMGAMLRSSKVRDTGVEYLVVGMRLGV